MKPKKYISFLIACSIAAFSAGGYSSAYEDTTDGICGESLQWELDSTGTLTITGKGNMTDWRNPDHVPWSEYRNSISAIVVTDGVTSIGSGSFSFCPSLTTVTLPDTIAVIPDEAFRGCSALHDIQLPETVTTIGEYAFSDCGSLSQLTLPKESPQSEAALSAIVLI